MGRWSELAAALLLLLSSQQTPGEKRNSIAAFSGQKMDKSCGSPFSASENAGRAPLKVPMHWGMAGPKLSLLPMYGGQFPSQKRAMSPMGPQVEQVEQDFVPALSSQVFHNLMYVRYPHVDEKQRNPERFWIPENQKVSRQREAALANRKIKAKN
eukprot:s1082_g13.t1